MEGFMEARVISFIPPVSGVDHEFNTFRIGGFYATRLNVGDTVLLMNEKEKLVFGSAVVEAVDVGQLGEMCLIHGEENHTQIAEGGGSQSAERLYRVMSKIYGPQIAKINKKTTVISLRRIKECPKSQEKSIP
jgi:hypothetical protein